MQRLVALRSGPAIRSVRRCSWIGIVGKEFAEETSCRLRRTFGVAGDDGVHQSRVLVVERLAGLGGS